MTLVKEILLSHIKDSAPIVMDIGSRYTKIGYSGDNVPRYIISTSELIFDKEIFFRDLKDVSTIKRFFMRFIHDIYFTYLLVNPRDRMVILVSSPESDVIDLADTLKELLFVHFEIPSLVYLGDDFASLMALGLQSGIIVDCGQTETHVNVIYENHQFFSSNQYQNLGSDLIESKIREELPELEKFDNAYKIYENIKVRCCFVTSFERSKGQCFPPDLRYQVNSSFHINIPGKLRERVCECLYDVVENEHSLASIIVDAVVSSPIDIRRTVASNIVLTGGTSMLIGFKSRLQEEIQELIKCDKYKSKFDVENSLKFKFHAPTTKANIIPWVGASIMGCQNMNKNNIFTRQQYYEEYSIAE